MNVVFVYLRLYADCLKEALRGVRRNAWTLLLPLALMVVFALLAMPLSALAIVGGILLGLAMDALLSCYLYFLSEVVAKTPVRIKTDEFKRSIGVYFWSILNFGFVLWIATFLLEAALSGNPQGQLLFNALYFVAYLALNAVPETMYLRGTRGGLDTIRESFRFLQENWIEWFVPNLILGAAAYFLFQQAFRLPLGGTVLMGLVGGGLLHVLMIFRGHLYKALSGTSHRQRMYKLRMGL